MECPECRSSELVRQSDALFCNRCGLVIDDSAMVPSGTVSKHDRLEIVTLPTLEFEISPKMELYAFKLGLKNKRLLSDWSKLYGFSMHDEELKPSLKDKAQSLISIAIKKNMPALVDAQKRFDDAWAKIDSIYFAETENIMDFHWDSKEYTCYISLANAGGVHNSSHNYIMLNHRWKTQPAYVMAHELFHILFHKYVTRYFKEGYDDFDEELSEAIVNLVLLEDSRLAKAFPGISFSLDIYPKKTRAIAEKILPAWNKRESFKDFMVESYRILGRQKTWISY